MKISEKKFSDYNDFFAYSFPSGILRPDLRECIFRGESTASYELLPSALRPGNKQKVFRYTMETSNPQSETEFWQIKAEYDILFDFYRACNENALEIPQVSYMDNNYIFHKGRHAQLTSSLPEPKWLAPDLANLAVLAQHYGACTRLLDWSFDIFTALYFASAGAMKRATSENKHPDDDYMVIWALNSYQIDFIAGSFSEIPLKMVVPHYSGNPNLAAQKGVLTYWEIRAEDISRDALLSPQMKYTDRTSLDTLLQNFASDPMADVTILTKLMIPVQCCVQMYQSTSSFGYDAASLFPGYSGSVKKMEENYACYRAEKYFAKEYP